MTSVQHHIAEHQAEAERLAALLRMYPDLVQETNRARRVFQCSKAVNAIATDYEISPSCSCCPDPELYVRVFVDTPHGRVYGFPYQMGIGERDGIDYPADNWDEMLRERGVHGSILASLQQHFDNQVPTEEGDAEVVCSGESRLERRAASSAELSCRA